MKLTPLKISMCLSVLIHGGILSAYLAYRPEPNHEHAVLNDERGLAIEIVSDPLPDAPGIPMPLPVKLAAIPNPPPLTPPVITTEIKQTVPVAAVVLPATKETVMEVANSVHVEPVVNETRAAFPSTATPGGGNSSLEITGGTTANYLVNPRPFYPSEARKRKEEGLVILAVQVNREGFPDGVRIAESSGFPLLDNAAAEAVKRWRFSPARVGSLAMASQIEVPIRFKLTDSQ